MCEFGNFSNQPIGIGEKQFQKAFEIFETHLLEKDSYSSFLDLKNYYLRIERILPVIVNG